MDASNQNSVALPEENRSAGALYELTEFEKYLKSARNMAIGLGLWGLVNLFTGSSPFAATLFILALISVKLRSVALLAIYAIFFLWAALFNLIAVGDNASLFWAAILALSAIREFHRYLKLRPDERLHLQSDAEDAPQLARTRLLLPLLAAAVALAAWLSYAASGILIFAWIALSTPADSDPPALLLFFNVLSPMVGALGLAMGGAALLSGYRRKLFSIVAILSGGALVGLDLGLLLLWA